MNVFSNSIDVDDNNWIIGPNVKSYTKLIGN